MNVLHSQERKVARKQRGWRDYYFATQSDTGVSAFWRWLSTHAGQCATEISICICIFAGSCICEKWVQIMSFLLCAVGAGGNVTYSDGVSAELPAQKSNEYLLNHYERHTKYCPACQKVPAFSQPVLKLQMPSLHDSAHQLIGRNLQAYWLQGERKV